MFVEQQVVKTRVKRDHKFLYSSPTDSEWKSQWYLVSPKALLLAGIQIACLVPNSNRKYFPRKMLKSPMMILECVIIVGCFLSELSSDV